MSLLLLRGILICSNLSCIYLVSKIRTSRVICALMSRAFCFALRRYSSGKVSESNGSMTRVITLSVTKADSVSASLNSSLPASLPKIYSITVHNMKNLLNSSLVNLCLISIKNSAESSESVYSRTKLGYFDVGYPQCRR